MAKRKKTATEEVATVTTDNAVIETAVKEQEEIAEIAEEEVKEEIAEVEPTVEESKEEEIKTVVEEKPVVVEEFKEEETIVERRETVTPKFKPRFFGAQGGKKFKFLEKINKNLKNYTWNGTSY